MAETKDQDELISIALNLKTNFAKELVNATSQLNKFGDRASAISKTSVGSLESLNRQFAVTLRSMYGNTSKEMQSFVGAISGQVGILEARNKQFVDKQIKTAELLKKNYEEVYKYFNQVERFINNMQKKATGPQPKGEDGKFTKRFTVKDVEGMMYVRGQLEGMIGTFQENFRTARASLIRESVSLIKQNVNAVTTASVRSLEFVGKTANDILSKIQIGKLAVGTMAETSGLLKTSEMLAQAKAGRTALSSLYRDQAARLAATARSRREVEAIARSVPTIDPKIHTPAQRKELDALRQSYLDVAMAIKKSEEQARQSMMGMRTHIQAVNRTVKDLETDMVGLGAKAGTALKKGIISESNLSSLFGKVMKSFGEQILYSTRTTDQAFIDAAKNSRMLQDRIAAVTSKLKAQQREAAALQKTGFLPESTFNTIKENISQRLEQIQQLSEKIKLLAKDFKQLAVPKNFAGMTDMGGVDKSLSNMVAWQKRMTSFSRVTPDNLSSFVGTWRSATASQEAFAAQVARTQKNILEITRTADRARELSVKETNEDIKKNYVQFADFMIAEAKKMQAGINTAMKQKIDMSGMIRDARIAAIQVHTAIKRTVPSAQEMKDRFNDIHKLYDDFTIYQQKTMRKWFVGDATRNQGRAIYNQIRSQIDNYREEYERIKSLYAQLRTIEKMGLGNPLTATMLKNTKSTLDAMKVSMLELARVNDQAGKKMELIQQRTIAGAISSGWNLVRNFRWQTAALGYFIYSAVSMVKRFVGNVFNEIYEFRKQSMSLAATFAFQMLGDLGTNFDKALSYSRNLMVQIQLVAAKTTLSLEDMFNLVRTFAQAGIIPKDRKDLEYIATIGTAIQAVTEGMANAGVQMKQELNALILGRQRATDSLAMMFQFMGVNIKEVMAKAKEEGQSMIKVFAEALEPFNEMMNRMQDEWGAVTNRINVAWMAIKRFALEGFLVKTSKEISNIVSQYFDETTGQLTQKGVEAAQMIQSIYEGAKAGIQATWWAFKTVFDLINSILNGVNDIKVALFGWIDGSKGFTGELRGWLMLMQEIAQFSYLAFASIKAAVAIIKAPIVGAWSLLKMAQAGSVAAADMHGGMYIDEEGAKESAETATKLMNEAVNDLQKAGEEVWNIPKNFIEGWNEIAKAFSSIATSSQVTKNNVESLSTFKLPVDTRMLAEESKALMKKFESEGISERTIAALANQLGGYTTAVSGQIKQVVKANDEVEAIIAEAAKQYGISADIIRAVAWKESRFKQEAVSNKGAIGVMQLMPSTAKELGVDPFNIRENIMGGAKYLRQMLDRYNQDLRLALAAYNAGPGNVDKAGGVPQFAETIEYVRDLTGETSAIITKLGIDYEELVKKGPAQFAEHAREAKEDFEKLEANLIKGKEAISTMMQQAVMGEIELTDKNWDYWNNVYAGMEKSLGMVRVYYALIDAKQKSQTDKFIKDQEMKTAREKRAYEDLLRDMSGRPMTMQEKYDDWLASIKNKLAELGVTNEQVLKNSSELSNALAEGSRNYWNKMWKEVEESYSQFEDKISSHKAKTPFESIRLEFEKLREEMVSTSREKSWTPDMIRDMKELLGLYEQERIHIEHINQMYDIRIKKLDLAIKRNEYFAGSYSPILQQQAAMNQLVLNYAKDTTEVEKSLADIDAKWKDINGNWKNTEGVNYIMELRDTYVESLKYMQAAYEREFFRKQHPLWAELVDLSKSWADGMTDALADFVDQTKTAKEAIADLTKSIQRDVLRAVIKNYITNPVMHFLGSGEPGSPTPYQQMAGTNASNSSNAAIEAAKKAASAGGNALNAAKKSSGAMDALIASGRPVPVYIVSDPNQIMQQAGEASKEATEGVQSAVNTTTQAINNQTSSEMSIFGQMLSALSSLHTWMANGGAIGNAAAGGGGGGGILGGLWEGISGLFGGGEASSSMTGMGDAAANVGGYGAAAGAAESAAFITMADGGLIKEQIIGRGLKSGATYSLGENTPYGENEIVAPIDKLSQKLGGGAGMMMKVSMPINIQAIDTQSGVDFLMKNNHVLEANMIKAIRNNRRIRDAIVGR